MKILKQKPGLYVLKAKVRSLVDGEEGNFKLQVGIKVTAIPRKT